MAGLGPWARSRGASKIPMGVPGPAKEERWGGLKGREQNPTNQEGSPRDLAPSKLLVGRPGGGQAESLEESSWGAGGQPDTEQPGRQQGHAHTRLTTSIPFNKTRKVM